MRKWLPGLLIFSLTFTIGALATRSPKKELMPIPMPPIETGSGPTPAVTEIDEPVDPHEPHVLDEFADTDTLSYRGYQIRRHHKTVNFDFLPNRSQVEVSYALLTKRNKTVAAFDGVYHPMGNETQFGLFKLLRNGSRQLVVEQNCWRAGAHWIVDFSRGFRLIYDSSTWNVGREELSVIDLDGDGQDEIIQTSNAFYEFMDIMAMGAIPQPRIIFKYDARAGRYVPANRSFPEYIRKSMTTDLELIQQEQAKLPDAVLPVVLDYIYLGQEKKGWKYFERACGYCDKQELRQRIKAILRKDPVYRYTYRRESLPYRGSVGSAVPSR